MEPTAPGVFVHPTRHKYRLVLLKWKSDSVLPRGCVRPMLSYRGLLYDDVLSSQANLHTILDIFIGSHTVDFIEAAYFIVDRAARHQGRSRHRQDISNSPHLCIVRIPSNEQVYPISAYVCSQPDVLDFALWPRLRSMREDQLRSHNPNVRIIQHLDHVRDRARLQDHIRIEKE